MMLSRLFPLLFLIITLSACEPEGRIYNEHQELSPQMEWLKNDKKEFKVTIDDNSLTYQLRLSFRYATGYPFQQVRVKVTETSPSGAEIINEYDLKVREDNGDYIGEAALDIWDSEHLVESSKTYKETGTYTYVIEHNMPVDPLSMAMEIGLIVDKAN